MLSWPEPVRVFLCLEPTDMRKGFYGLSALVTEWLGQDPLSGHLFVFRNRRGDRVKLLYWDRDGYALFYKHLERGVFRFPPPDPACASPQSASGRNGVEVTVRDLSLLLWGIDPASVRRQKRYRRPAPPA